MMMAWLLATAAVQASTPVAGPQITREEAEARMANCGSRRFESVAEYPVNGKIRRVRLPLCAPDSATNDEWIATLERNEAIVRGQAGLPEEAKQKLIGDLRVAIDRLRGVNALGPVKSTEATPQKSVVVVPKSDFDIAALPPLPPPIKAAPGGATASTGAGTSRSVSRPVLAPALKPRLAVKCAAPNLTPISCDRVAIDESLVIEAQESLVSPLTLTFRHVKSGVQSDVPVGRLKQGQSVRMSVPSAICKGVVRATFEIQVAGAGNGKMPYRDVLGPYKKDC